MPSDKPHVHLVGNSMGGLVGVFLAGQRPAALRSLVINDVGSLVSWSSLITLFGAISASVSSQTFQGWSQGSRQLAQTLNVDHKLMSAILQLGYLDIPHSRAMSGVSFRQAFLAVDVPVLMIHSADSPIFTASVRSAMRDLPSNYSFLEVDGKNHPVTYTEHVCKMIQKFIEGAEKSDQFKAKEEGMSVC